MHACETQSRNHYTERIAQVLRLSEVHMLFRYVPENVLGSTVVPLTGVLDMPLSIIR